MKKLAILFLALTLGACASQPREMPTNEGDESDTMKISPCACVEQDFNKRGYTWVS